MQRVSSGVGNSGNSGNRRPPFASSVLQQAEEAEADQARILLQWLIERLPGQMVSVKHVQQFGPYRVRQIGADGIRSLFQRLRAGGYLSAPADGQIVNGLNSQEAWQVTEDREVQDSLHLADLSNDVLCWIVDLLDGDTETAARALLLAAANLLNINEWPAGEAAVRADVLASAIAGDVANAPVIRLVPVENGVAMRFENVPRRMAERTVSSMEVARTFAIAMHECHGWAIRECSLLADSGREDAGAPQ